MSRKQQLLKRHRRNKRTALMMGVLLLVLVGILVAWWLPLLLAVVAWVKQQRPDDALWLAGFSFGAYVSLSAANAVQPGALISIAPPAGRWNFDKIVLPTCPWLLIQGDEDEVVEPQAVYAWVDTLQHVPVLMRMPGTSHSARSSLT